MRRTRRFFEAALVLLFFSPGAPAAAEGPRGAGAPVEGRGAFDGAAAYARVVELSSPAYAGRLVGSSGNFAALDYLEAEFRRIGLEPLPGREGYRLPFASPLAVQASEPLLEVYEDGRLLSSYRRFRDFRETYYGRARPGDIRGSALLSREARPAGLGEAPILVYAGGPPESLDGDSLLGRGLSGLILLSDEGTVSRKSPNLGLHRFEGTEGFVTFLAAPRLVEELSAHLAAGRELRLRSDFEISWVETANLAAYLPAPGRRKGRLQILSAHLDHLGMESEGSLYPGALDNASGVALLLGLAESLAARRGELRSGVLFLAFNGEEEGLQGSRRFVEEPPLPLAGAELLNLDSLGGREARTLLLLSAGPGPGRASEPSAARPLEERMARLAAERGLPTQPVRGSLSSDHAPFAWLSLPALSLSEDPLGPYHSARDLPEGLDPARLQAVGELALACLEESLLGPPARAGLGALWPALAALAGLALLALGALLLLRRRASSRRASPRPAFPRRAAPPRA